MAGQPLMNTYARLPVTFTKGEGAWLYDTEGKRYLDALSGIAVCNLGHSHPAVTRAICEQAAQLIHTSNLYGIAKQTELASALTAVSGMEQAFFCNSGAEANEAAIKIARLYGHRKNISTPTIIVMDNAFHGRTMGTLTATGNRKVQAGFEPLLSGFVRATYNDVDAIRNIIKHTPNVVAILVEPVQGEGGVSVPDADYLSELRAICDQHDLLLMLDEVQTGNGRTGAYFAYQHSHIRPDVVTTAKGLGNGFPIGACLTAGKASDILQPGNHGSTFGGNPLACAAALAVVNTLQTDNLCERAAELGQRMLNRFQSALADHAQVKAIRGLGLMLGIELDRPCTDLVNQALAEGLLINVTAGNVIRLLPPLILSDAEADQIVDQVVALINRFSAQ